MLEWIKTLVDKFNTAPQNNEEDEIDPHLAVAVLLMEAANADGEFSSSEKKQLAQTLVNQFGIIETDIDDLIERSIKAHREYVDLFRYSRVINDHFSRPEKRRILESAWRIILLDDHLEAHEDHFVHKLANLLGFGHSDLIDAKLNARKQLLSG